MNAVEVKELGKRYSGHCALGGVSFAVEGGGCFFVSGKNGAGKTTLLEIVAGLKRQTSGVLRLFGKEIGPDCRASSLGVDGVFERSFLYSDLNVYENLRFFAAIRNISGADRKVEDLLKRFNLLSKARSLVKHLSCGQEKAVGIIRAALGEPRLLLLDEPYKGLDEEIRRSLEDFLKEMMLKGTTIIYSGHEREPAAGIDCGMLLLDSGKTIHCNRPGG